MNPDPVVQLADALAAAEQVLGAVGNDQWANPTPCPAWTVRQVAEHLVGGNLRFARVLRGEPPAEGGEPVVPAHDGGGVLDAYRASARALIEAFQQSGALERVITVPVGRVPGSVALHLRIVEALVHGWDLAQATGQHPDFPGDLAEQELAFSRSMVPNIPADRAPFAAPEPVAGDAPAIERLAAFLGRSVAPGGASARPGEPTRPPGGPPA